MATELKNYDNVNVDLENDKITQTKPKKPLTEMLAANIKAFGQTPEKVKEGFLQIVSINPELKKADPTSLVLAIAQVMRAGVSMNPIDAQVAIIPYKIGMKSVAQIQFMWKGYRDILLRESKGVKDLIVIEVKEGDIETIDMLNGEVILSKTFEDKSFENHNRRKKLPTIGYLAIIDLDEKIYNQKSFGSYMDRMEMAEWKKEYGSRTKINDATYGKKTVAKRVIRDFKHKILWKSTAAVNSTLELDQSANDGQTIDYVEKGGENA